jgi:hypothetical protein
MILIRQAELDAAPKGAEQNSIAYSRRHSLPPLSAANKKHVVFFIANKY